MGGHGHHPVPEIPCYTKYKWETVPELVKLQKDLGKLGLKDPWARNQVWRYHPGFGTKLQRILTCCFRGWKVGVPAFLITIAAEKALGIDYGGHGHH
ncbi:NADH dehydrogenase [ubiquinone] 1 beta subcomplex subunit 3 [Leptopilina heterotoma]|uniref:NADH dehydrogenase [ubiquinone] 1 beta subcomplex subunit 3 n=1 Tax=Leptopilina heterotoma TaxID=63436 RepID=UPI001CA933E1|nr:NADH dehydrogenase [ubiquinone] 1 beta subcomplex subunit 3 [Leptopilina heterotoma]